MKQKMKRLTSVLLALVMVLGMLPFMSTTAHAAGNIVNYDVPGGKIKFDKDTETITGYSGNPTDVIIPASIDGVAVTSIGIFAFSRCDSLKSVTIPGSVKSIEGIYDRHNYVYNPGDPQVTVRPHGGAFSECQNLESVTIENGVTSIGPDAFYGCVSLTSVTIPDSVTIIGGSFDPEGGILTGGAFGNCVSLTSVTIPDSVTSIGAGAFQGCTSLTSVNIPDGVTYIGELAFADCESLKSVTIPGSVKSITGGIFSISPVHFYTHGVFSNCTALESVIIGNGVTSIEYGAFKGCTSLKSVNIPDSVTSIGSDAFTSCKGLTSVTIPNSVTSIGSYAFGNCTALATVSLGNGLTEIGNDVFNGTAFYNDEKNWTDGVLYCGNVLIKAKQTISGAYTIKGNTKFIMNGAFEGCEGLTSVTIPDSVTSIGYSAFEGCESLTSVTIPNGVTVINDYTFYGCTKLATVRSSVTRIGSYAFSGTAFYNDDKNWKDGALYYGSILIRVKYDRQLSEYTIKNGTTCIAGSAFYDHYYLKSLKVPDSVRIVMPDAFKYANDLRDVEYDGYKYQWKQIEISSVGNDRLLSPRNGITFLKTGGYFPLWIGGTQVAIDNPTGTGWSYDPVKNILTLKNASITGAPDHSSSIYTEGISYEGDITDHLTLVLEGDNTVTGIAADGFSYGIFCAGPLTITGTGSLTVTGGQGEQGSFAIEARKLVIEDGTVTATGGVVTQQENPKSFGLAGAPDGITIKGGTVTAAGQTNAFYCDPVIQSANLQVTVSANPSGSGAAPWKAGDGDLGGDDSTFKYVKIAPPGGVTPEEGYTVTLDDKTAGAATVSGIESGSKYSGETTFTVTCANACAVAVTTDGGTTYTRLRGTVVSGDCSFTVNVTQDATVAIVLKGDANLNGTVNQQDATIAKATLSEKRTLNALQTLAADVTGDGNLAQQDITRLKAVVSTKTALSWDTK